MDVVLASDNQGYGSALYINGKLEVGATGGGTYDKLHAIKEHGGEIDSLDSITFWDDFNRWPDTLKDQRTVKEMTKVITKHFTNVNAEEATKISGLANDINENFRGSVTDLTVTASGSTLTAKGARCLIEKLGRRVLAELEREI